MGELVNMVKAEALQAMYRSVDRMNHAIADDNHEVYQSEVGLQKNLRSNFEELQEN